MSVPWISGGRMSARVIERHLASALLHDAQEAEAARAAARCVRIWRHAGETLGPASGARAVWQHLVHPCAEVLGWSPGDPREQRLAGMQAQAAAARLGDTPVLIVALPWGASQDGLLRASTRLGTESGSSWVGVCNATSWRWYDATRPYGREHLGLDLTHATVDARVWHALWLLGRRPRTGSTGPGGSTTWLEHLVAASVTEVAGSAGALRHGLAATLSDLAREVPAARDEHVTQIFQWLFLLFAEARELLPTWHPPYRRSYALTTVAREAARHTTPRMGLHDSVAAVARVGRDGMSLGRLRVPALGGQLFAETRLTRRASRLPDAVVGRMLLRLVHGDGSRGGRAIAFGELDVEHLGSMYEHLMAPPAPGGGAALIRKRTGAFYTPRTLADLLVQRTLEPLVRDASSAQILSLRVVDPAMGSGALLASALRYLAGAVEAAWVREGRGGPLDVPRQEREALPRRIAERCLYGVDTNTHAVQVARLSMWLLSLAPERPLTWLDAHLRVGNSLVGASPALVLGRAPVRDKSACRRSGAQLTLFDLTQWHHEAAQVGPLLEALSARPTNSAQDARDKSRAFAALRERDGLASWRARADAWCGAAMDAEPAAASLWRAVDDHVRGGAGDTAGHIAARAARWRALAQAERSLHWSVEFPDVFDAGRGGFDAVLANPPWEMLRGDLGSGAERASQREDLGPLLRFVRRSGVYRESGGHMNSYQLFVERMLQLLRPGGRIGCLLPGSILADHGAARLRRHVFAHAAIDRIAIFDNRDAFFPVHRSIRIVCLTGTAGSATEDLLVDDGAALRMRGVVPSSRPPRLLTRALLRRASADAESVPHLRSGHEMSLFERLLASPRLGSGGWELRFGRELNATEDRGLLRQAPCDSGLAVIDGKHLQAFAVRPPADGPWIREEEARTALPAEPWRHWRLAYRDVSSPTNTRSLIAALLPPGCVSTHTVFCLRNRLGLTTQLYLCGMLNSLVADWFVRRYLGAHVTTRLIATLPVPRVPASDPSRRRVVRLAARLMRAPSDEDALAGLHASAAALYGLDAHDLACIADDFPRVPAALRARMADLLPRALNDGSG